MASIPLPMILVEKAIQEFTKRWFTGLQPKLTLEANQDGSISINSSVQVQECYPH